MTTPQQPPPQQPPQQDSDAALVAAIATALVIAISAAAAYALIRALLRRRAERIGQAEMLAALTVVMAMPPELLGVTGSATIAMSRANTLRRAQFALAAARRLTADVRTARSRGQNIGQALAAGIARERRYFGQHLNAIRNRMQAAMNTDIASWSYGDLLGWNTVQDSRTSPECRAADGMNFYASSPPLIGYPGAVHPHCRCYPGPAHVGGRMLPSAGEPQKVLVRV